MRKLLLTTEVSAMPFAAFHLPGLSGQLSRIDMGRGIRTSAQTNAGGHHNQYKYTFQKQSII